MTRDRPEPEVERTKNQRWRPCRSSIIASIAAIVSRNRGSPASMYRTAWLTPLGRVIGMVAGVVEMLQMLRESGAG